MKKSAKPIDAGTFQRPLETLAETLIQRLKNEWPRNLAHLPHLQMICRYTLGYCLCVFRAECTMFSDERREDHRWRWDGVTLLPASNRTLLDALFNLIFMFEDVESRSTWYLKSGWREQKVEYERWNKEYSSDPDWIDWLPGLEKLVERGVEQFNIPKEEVDNPKLIKAWPSSGQMPDFKIDPRKRPRLVNFCITYRIGSIGTTRRRLT